MSLSMVKVGTPYLPMCSFSAQRPKGERILYANMNSLLQTAHPIGLSPRAQPLKTRRLVANSSQFTRAESILLGPKVRFNPFQSRTIKGATQMGSSLAVSASAHGAVAETQTAPRRSSISNSAPGKESLPLLDNGGSGFSGNNDNFKPYYRGDDSGAGGGSGGGRFSSSGEFPWGDFWFFIFLFLLRFLFTQIIAEGYFNFKHDTGKHKPIQHYI